jgi:hypothetical protein
VLFLSFCVSCARAADFSASIVIESYAPHETALSVMKPNNPMAERVRFWPKKLNMREYKDLMLAKAFISKTRR